MRLSVYDFSSSVFGFGCRSKDFKSLSAFKLHKSSQAVGAWAEGKRKERWKCIGQLARYRTKPCALAPGAGLRRGRFTVCELNSWVIKRRIGRK